MTLGTLARSVGIAALMDLDPDRSVESTASSDESPMPFPFRAMRANKAGVNIGNPGKRHCQVVPGTASDFDGDDHLGN
jgi:hypothetical protein